MTIITLVKLPPVVMCPIVDLLSPIHVQVQVISPPITIETEYSLSLDYSSHRRYNTTFGHIYDVIVSYWDCYRAENHH